MCLISAKNSFEIMLHANEKDKLIMFVFNNMFKALLIPLCICASYKTIL